MSWRALSLDELEQQYSPSSRLEHPIGIEIQAYVDRSADARAQCDAAGSPVIEISYGNTASHTIDLVVPPPDRRPSTGAPLVCYFHGGYWQELSRRESFFAAHDAIGRGWAFAAVDYTLAPAATLDEIVAECRAATSELVDRAPSLDLDPARFVLAGSSAGAHLAAMVALEPRAGWAPAGAVLVSGVYDLEPLVDTYVNDALALDTEQARANSPLALPIDDFPRTVIAIGDNETEEFGRQSLEFASRLEQIGVPVEHLVIPNRHHFDVVLELCDPSTSLGRTLGIWEGDPELWHPDPTMTDSDAAAEPITVFLLDDHEIVRIGVADLIDSEPDMQVVGQADDAAEAVRAIGRLQPDVALLDVRLQAGNGIEVCRQVTELHPNVACIMLTSFDDDHALLEAAEAGAVAFVLKQVRRNEIVSSIRKVADGAVLLDSATVRMGRQRLETDESTQLDQLTDQERRVFDLIGEGCTNRQIAERLFVAEKTVKNYVTSMLAKLNLSRRTEAAAMAARIEERDRRRYE